MSRRLWYKENVPKVLNGIIINFYKITFFCALTY